MQPTWKRPDGQRISNKEFWELAARLTQIFKNRMIEGAAAVDRGMPDHSDTQYAGGMLSVFCTECVTDHIVLERNNTSQVIVCKSIQGESKNLRAAMKVLGYVEEMR